ncbi:signal peptidase I [Candidatus Uhrbacteria bacterium]|nr:signal peptidase I [Candidatus Uhrbacteria bacterium]
MKHPALQYLVFILLYGFIISFMILFLRTTVFDIGIVNGRSMERAYIDEDLFLVNKIGPLFIPFRRGDVIQFYDKSSRKLLIKRVIGLPGETVKISRHTVLITDGKGGLTELSEPYLKAYTSTDTSTGEVIIYDTIPPFSYFVLGDNRSASTDSRTFGAVHRSLVTGLVIRIPW